MTPAQARAISKELVDMLGRPFVVGDRTVRVAIGGGCLFFCTVTKISDGQMYTDDSPIAVEYPGRHLIVTEQIAISSR